MAKRTDLEVFPGSRVTAFSIEASGSFVEFNLLGFGCPASLCLRLGDRVIGIDFPDGFPERTLDYRNKDITVYGSKQDVRVTSEPNRQATNAAITLSTSRISVPFQLTVAGEQLLAGLPVDERRPVYDYKGNLLWYVVTPSRTEFERTVISGGACRPNCRYTSLLESKLEYPWKEEYADIFEDFIVQHYKRRVDYNWSSFHCENGRWKFIRTDVDTQTETKAVRKKTF